MSVTIESALSAVRNVPQNSAAGIARIVGINVDPQRYGSDCLGRLGMVVGMLNADARVEYLYCSYGNIIHLSALINGEYVDPHLHMASGLSVTESTDQKMSVPSFVRDMVVTGKVDSNRLAVEYESTSEFRRRNSPLIRYTYELDDVLNTPPDDSDFVRISIPYTVCLVDGIGLCWRALFQPKDRSWMANPINNWDRSFDGNDSLSWFDGLLRDSVGLTIADMTEYFVAVNEGQKYMYYWEHH